jgi:RNA polymerase sigma-70 factor (ECF subfamily)
MAETPRDTTNLVHRLQAGDRSAQAELIAHACERLRQLSRAFLREYPTLRGLEQTDDVLGGAVIRLMKALKDAKPESSAHFYNLASQHIRWELDDLVRRYRGRSGQRPRQLTNSGGGDNPDPLGSLAGGEEPGLDIEWAELMGLVDALPEQEREVFRLLWFHQLSREEAAAVLDISVKSVGRRWQAARIKLGGALKRCGYFPGADQ